MNMQCITADKILLSDAVFTGDGSPCFPGGVAIKENKIIAVGREEFIRQLKGNDTRVYEYGDKLIMPGFFDSHVHFSFGAYFNSEFFTTDILESKSEEDAVRMVKEFADAHPDYERIIGQGWFPVNWGNADLPTKYSLDEVIPDRPVYLASADTHTGWMNSKALAECGADPDSPLLGANVVVLPSGEMSGCLREDAWIEWGCDKVIQPDMKISEIIEKNLLKELAKCGITSVSDMSGTFAFVKYDSLEKLEKDQQLNCRVFLNVIMEDDPDQKKALALRERFHSERLQVTGVKKLVDGVTSTYTGYLLEPYADKPEWCGSPIESFEFYKNAIIAANRKGLGVRVHCIADGSVRLALDCFEESKRVNTNYDQVRNGIEHIENIHPDDIKRFKELNIVASVQPRHLPLDANEKITRLGEERCRYEWPFRTFLDQKVVLAFGTDYPVVDYDPFSTIYYAVTRNGYDGNPTGVNFESEKVSMAEALKASTWGGAYAANREHVQGTLAEGMLADIIVLDRNLFKTEADEILNTKVILTIMDGNVIYEMP